MLPTRLGTASLRQTSRLRRKTGSQRQLICGVRKSPYQVFLVFGISGLLEIQLSGCRARRTEGFWGQSPNSLSLRLARRVRCHAPQRNWCLTPITHEDSEHRATQPCARELDLENVSLCGLPDLAPGQLEEEVLKIGRAVQRAQLRIVG